ncbi:hypothetical protein [Microbacterium terrisoli]|uniref:hypothetical protein n=1 Tax=Microbacterium terrisoli TaxID=3242192 RepID=UPI002805ABA0|nr:hypothetical protein [Microbacterium protaetiae]
MSKWKNKRYDRLTDEEQDLLFYAILDARDAAAERWAMEFGKVLPPHVELAIVEQYANQLHDELGPRTEAWSVVDGCGVATVLGWGEAESSESGSRW